MANILNQKEEVISIELTKEGRKMLALGYFQPKYFAFYDDTILYDLKYTGDDSENTNDIQNRILDESLTLRSLNLNYDYLRDRLGTSDMINDFAPAWSLKILNGGITYLKDNSSYYRKRFDVKNITYKIIFDEMDMQNIPDVQDDYFLIDLQELNLSDDIINYEIEVFTYDELSGGINVDLKRRLMFTEKKNNIIDDILYEDNELPSNYFNSFIDKNDVAYYYDILVDDEIDTDFIKAKEKTIKDKVFGTYQSDYTGPIDPKC